jgi:hypothetical protein
MPLRRFLQLFSILSGFRGNSSGKVGKFGNSKYDVFRTDRSAQLQRIIRPAVKVYGSCAELGRFFNNPPDLRLDRNVLSDPWRFLVS